MAVYAVTIVPLSTPAVVATGAGISYQQLINSFGQYNFLIDDIFIQCRNISQLQQQFMFESYDSTGTRYTRPMNSAVDPYQSRASLYTGTRDEKVIINSRTFFSFPFIPREQLSFQAIARKNYIGDFLVIRNKMLAQPPSRSINPWARVQSRPERKASFSIRLKNNTDSAIYLNLLALSSYNDIFNATTEYLWNLTIEDYTNSFSVTIQAKKSGQSSYQNYTASLLSLNTDGVVAALNTLGIGTFWNQNGYVVTTNDNLVYNDLTINNSPTPVTTPTTINWQNGIVIAQNSLKIYKNAAIQVNSTSMGSGSFSADNADQILSQVTAGSDFVLAGRLVVERIQGITQEILYTGPLLNIGETDQYQFTVDSDWVYNITWAPDV